ncbi:MAG: glutathione S-transferase family protein [Rhodospirillaceae bacterium]
MIVLHGKAISRAARCIWALEEVGVEYEHNLLDYTKGEAKTDAFLAINPNAKIPALTDGDVAMFESLAINLYITQTYGQGKLWPTDAAGQAACQQWTLFAATELEPPAARRLVEFVFKSEVERSQLILDEAAVKSKGPLDALDLALRDRKYLLGGSFTVADLNVACVVEYFVRTDFDLSDWPNVKGWITSCLERSAFTTVTDIKAREAA